MSSNTNASSTPNNPLMDASIGLNIIPTLSSLVAAKTSVPQATYGERPLGYEGYTKWLASSSEDLLVFRRFGALNIRNLLYLQDELSVLETQLSERDALLGENGSRRGDGEIDPMRVGIMKQVRETLKEYNAALIAYAAVAKLPEAEERQQHNIQTWLQIHNPLSSAEQQYIGQSDDLLTLLHTDKDAVYRFIQSHEDTITTMTRSKVERYSAYYPERYIYRAARTLCAIGGWIFLLVPVILLCVVDGTAKMLGIIGAFVTAFLMLLAIGTNAKNWEILSCCAAYAAVLVVFMGGIKEKGQVKG